MKAACSLLVASALGLLVSVPASSQVVVDGSPADLVPLAQDFVVDPANDVCSAGRSGFDFTRVLVYYDVVQDRLYFGIVVLDVPPGTGLSGPGVPGDADGDGNPDTLTTANCVVSPFFEEVGVGPDEEYTFLLDTNFNGTFTDASDVRVSYTNNSLLIRPGNSSVPIPGATGDARLGTAGCPVATGIPDVNENRNTTDIEIAVDHWSTLDPTPLEFCYQLRAGSLVDGLPEDVSLRRCVVVKPPCEQGNVGTSLGALPTDVLFVNGTAGGGTRTVTVPRNSPIRIDLNATPAGPATATYVLWFWAAGRVNAADVETPRGRVGCTSNPSPIGPAASLAPQPFRCLRGVGIPLSTCGTAMDVPGPARAPWSLTRPGINQTLDLTVQGLIRDDGAPNTDGFSVTNAVTIHVQ